MDTVFHDFHLFRYRGMILHIPLWHWKDTNATRVFYHSRKGKASPYFTYFAMPSIFSMSSWMAAFWALASGRPGALME